MRVSSCLFFLKINIVFNKIKTKINECIGRFLCFVYFLVKLLAKITDFRICRNHSIANRTFDYLLNYRHSQSPRTKNTLYK